MERYGKDSKHSWLVLFASSLIKFMAFGPVECAGILMVSTALQFNTTREEASLPYTLIYTIRNGSGPIIAYVGNIIGLRYATLLGCILSSFAIAACFLAENVMTVTILWGILLGLGFGFQSLLVNAVLMEHFEKNLSKAVGVVTAGAISGIVIFASFLSFLEDSYGLSGAFLLMAGVTLHAIPAAIFVTLNKPVEHSSMMSKQNTNKNPRRENGFYRKRSSHFEENLKEFFVLTQQRKNSLISAQNNDGVIKSIYSKNFQSSCNESHLQCKLSNLNADMEADHIKKPDQWKDFSFQEKCGELKTIPVVNFVPSCNDSQLQSKIPNLSTNIDACQIKKQDQWVNIQFPEKCGESKTQSNTDSVPSQQKSTKIIKTLFTQPTFWLILICNGIHYFTLPAFVTLLVDYAIDIGINPAYSKYVVIYANVIDLVGCLLLGWIADLGFVSSNVFAVLCFMIQTATLVLIIWAQNVILFALAVLSFQWTQSGLNLIYPAVIADTLEKDIRSSAIACLYLLAAPLDLAISPLIGYFRDERGSYAGVYLTLAAAEFFGGLVQLCVMKRANDRKRSQSTQHEKTGSIKA